MPGHEESMVALIHGYQMAGIVDGPELESSNSFVETSDLAINFPFFHDGIPE